MNRDWLCTTVNFRSIMSSTSYYRYFVQAISKETGINIVDVFDTKVRMHPLTSLSQQNQQRQEQNDLFDVLSKITLTEFLIGNIRWK